MKKLILSIALTLLALQAGMAQAGNLDSTFSADGLVMADFSNSPDEAYSVVIQPDGKIVVAGVSFNGANDDFAVARFNVDGTLDNAFGLDGKITTAIGEKQDFAYSAALQADGKIVLAGETYNGSDFDIAIARYNADGSLDNTFDADGRVITGTDEFKEDVAYSVALQPDGKIVVAGFSGEEWVTEKFALARYKMDGTLDNSFGSEGFQTTAFGFYSGIFTRAYSMAIQPDGKIVLAGTTYNGDDLDFALARFNTDGTLDGSFGIDGKLTTAPITGDDIAHSVALQPDGKIVVAGQSVSATGDDYFALARYLPNGTLDNSFSEDGMLKSTIGNANIARSVAIQPDGKIVIAGSTIIDFSTDFALIRYQSNGYFDLSFGENGKLTTSFGTGIDWAYSIALQADGKIVVAGHSSSSGIGVDFALARYLSGLEVGVLDFSSALNSVFIYPNPLAEKATLSYEIPQSERISIVLYNIKGKAVRTFLANEWRPAGPHEESLDFSRILSGSYFLTIDNGKGKCTIKVVK